ncbi:MAG: hypothetical protein ABSG35_14110 [Syntrophobacteraceae bacterium]
MDGKRHDGPGSADLHPARVIHRSGGEDGGGSELWAILVLPASASAGRGSAATHLPMLGRGRATVENITDKGGTEAGQIGL